MCYGFLLLANSLKCCWSHSSCLLEFISCLICAEQGVTTYIVEPESDFIGPECRATSLQHTIQVYIYYYWCLSMWRHSSLWWTFSYQQGFDMVGWNFILDAARGFVLCVQEACGQLMLSLRATLSWPWWTPV